MAQVDDTAGIPTVAPDTSVPDRYQHISAQPDQFGGLIAQGLEKVGQGASQANQFYSKVAADDATNQFQDFSTKLLHGDPSQPGPDGQPDTGYMGLRGDAALRQRPEVEKALDEKLKEIRGKLETPEQQLEFDNYSRKYRSNLTEKIGTHADGQATVWYQSVNDATSKLALDHIATNADNPNEWMAGESDLIHAYVKNAQLKFGDTVAPGNPQYEEAVASARRDALKARLDAVAVKDPLKAQSILDIPANKQIAGQYYDNMSASYRGRAKQAQGYGVSDAYIQKSYTQNPAINPVVLTNAGAKYGISASYLAHTQNMETGHNPNQTSSTGAQGPFQFIGSTARQYGLKDPFNYAEAADAAARFAADNKVALTSALGRPPSDPELYLAHNQGSAGAAALLAHPNQRAGDLVGDRAIRVNGGDPNAPAAAFTSMMTQKYNGAPVAATMSRKAEVVGNILADPDLDPDVRQHAIQHAEQTFAAQAIAEEQDARAQKARFDKMQSDFYSRIIKGDTNGIIGELANSGLPGPEMKTLYDFAIAKGGINDPLQYGPAYTDTMKRLLAPPDSPDRLDNIRDIIQMGNDGKLTPMGVDKLIKTQKELQADPESAGVTRTKVAQLDYYKSKFSLPQEAQFPGDKVYKSQKGLDKFNHDFVPAFESAYGDWVKSGKPGMDFLKDTKGLDAIADRVYPPSERAKDALADDASVDPTKVPPPPAGTDAKAWTSVVGSAPNGADGKPIPPATWAKAVTLLRDNPDEKHINAFNARMKESGITAQDVFKKLPPTKPMAAAMPAGEGGSPLGEPDVPPQEPGFLTKLRESNRAALEKMDNEPKDEGPGLLDRIASHIPHAKPELTPTNIGQIGIRG
jgi:hypothetical protein